MSRIINLAILVTVFYLSQTVLCSAIEPDGRIAREALGKEVVSFIQIKDYKKLEDMANRFRDKKERFPDGAWKLHAFYKGIDEPGFKTDQEWLDLIKHIELWEVNYPNSPTPKLALAAAWKGYGWYARGTNFQVKPGGASKLKERMDQTRKILSNKEVVRSCPHYYDLKLQMATADGVSREEFELRFKDALAFEPGYHGYYAAAINYYADEWYGETGEWVRQLKRFDDIAPKNEGVYARLGYGMMPKNWKSFDEGKVTWERMKHSLEQLPQGSPWVLNMRAALACQAGDMTTARPLIEKIGETPYYKAWKEVKYDKCREMAGLKKIGWNDSMEYHYLKLLAERGNVWAQTTLETNIRNGMVGYPRKGQ
ncbi:hypothetical protein [Geotalea uraniireducens]|uniref:DUF4034 domain-containing protein n=1 Tax=Geotalea uraniireducens (strain Rf4) TaxID=351605 RepID=A5GE17_GEOUR|nr:hypothetical protein [Geotalea uraniireducens]ABQ25672.1 hypothetical protein Gura_1473 [Geotalea uraniireducens Rf4]